MNNVRKYSILLIILVLVMTCACSCGKKKKTEDEDEAGAAVVEKETILVNKGFGSRLNTIINSQGYELEAVSETEFIARYEGDWHGMITFDDGQGRFYKALEKAAGEVVARFSFDQSGNCFPYLAMPLSDNYKDKNYRNVYASHEDTTGGLFVGGDFLLGSFATVIDAPDETGLLHFSFLLQDSLDPEYVNVNVYLRRVNTPWFPKDEVPVPPATFNHALNKTMEEQAAFFGYDVSQVPPVSHVTDWEIPYNAGLRVTKEHAAQYGYVPAQPEAEAETKKGFLNR